jgi:hypothetical protein
LIREPKLRLSAAEIAHRSRPADPPPRGVRKASFRVDPDIFDGTLALLSRLDAIRNMSWASFKAGKGDRQVVFVRPSGILSARVFAGHAKAVRAMGFPKERVSIIAARSAGELHEELLGAFERRGVPLVVFGARSTLREVLMSLLLHPELIARGVVDKAVLIEDGRAQWTPDDDASRDRALASLSPSLRAHLDLIVDRVSAAPRSGPSLARTIGRDLGTWQGDHWSSEPRDRRRATRLHRRQFLKAVLHEV